jgi:hypothetical protein
VAPFNKISGDVAVNQRKELKDIKIMILCYGTYNEKLLIYMDKMDILYSHLLAFHLSNPIFAPQN